MAQYSDFKATSKISQIYPSISSIYLILHLQSHNLHFAPQKRWAEFLNWTSETRRGVGSDADEPCMIFYWDVPVSRHLQCVVWWFYKLGCQVQILALHFGLYRLGRLLNLCLSFLNYKMETLLWPASHDCEDNWVKPTKNTTVTSRH